MSISGQTWQIPVIINTNEPLIPCSDARRPCHRRPSGDLFSQKSVKKSRHDAHEEPFPAPRLTGGTRSKLGFFFFYLFQRNRISLRYILMINAFFFQMFSSFIYYSLIIILDGAKTSSWSYNLVVLLSKRFRLDLELYSIALKTPIPKAWQHVALTKSGSV